MTWIECGPEHLEAIRAIFNEQIENSTALYEYVPRSAEYMKEWFADKQRAQLPLIGVTNDDGVLMGFATYGPFRLKPAYKYTVEHSVYVGKDFRGQGLGKALLQRIIDIAEEWGCHVIIGGIDAENTASVALHEKFGFRLVGTFHETGFKFGRWLDLLFYEKRLNGPSNPVDG